MLVGVILNRSDNSALRSEVRSEMAALRLDMVAFRNQVRQDMVMLHERVAVVEFRQNK